MQEQMNSMNDSGDFPSHFGSSHFLFERARCFPVHESFWFCRVQVSTTQFCSSPPVLMASVDDGSDVPISPMPGTSSNCGSPDGSGPDLDGMGHRSIDAQFKELRYVCCYHSRVDS